MYLLQLKVPPVTSFQYGQCGDDGNFMGIVVFGVLERSFFSS